MSTALSLGLGVDLSKRRCIVSLNPMWGARAVDLLVREVKIAQTFRRHQGTGQLRQTSCPARASSPPSARRRPVELVLGRGGWPRPPGKG